MTGDPFCVASITLCHGRLFRTPTTLFRSPGCRYHSKALNIRYMGHPYSMYPMVYKFKARNLMTLMTFNLQITLKWTKSSSFAHHNLHALPQIKGNTQGWRSKWKQITKYLGNYGSLWRFPPLSLPFFPSNPTESCWPHLEGPEPLRSPSCEAFSPTSWAKDMPRTPIEAMLHPRNHGKILGKIWQAFTVLYLIALSGERSEKDDSIDFWCLKWKTMIKNI